MRSLRIRLLAYFGLAVLVASLLTVGVAALLTRRDVEEQVLTNLDRQADAAVATLGMAGPTSAGRQTQVFFADQTPRRLGGEQAPGPLTRQVREKLPASGETAGTIEVGSRSLLYVTRETPAGRIAVVRSEELVAADWRPFVSSLVIAGLGGALVATLLSVFLARRLSRPLGDLARAATDLAGGDRDVRVEVPGHDEIARLAAAFNRMADELDASQQAEREFLLSVSHELKTPLTAIAGYAEAVAEGAVSGDEGAAVIRIEAARLERLVSDLLDLARLDRKAFSIARTRVDLAEVAGWARDRAAQRARELGVGLELDAGAPSWALADPDRLLQAISNLVENALRCTPSSGSVAIAAREGALTVRDTGPGFAEEDLPRAFDRFYLQARYRSDRPVGSGLGLAIVKQLVAAMGGSVSVASRPGHGATFTVQLQPADPPHSFGGGAGRTAGRAEGNGLKATGTGASRP